MTIELTEEEGRQLKAILLIVKNKTQKGPFWAKFFTTVMSVLEKMP